MEGQLAVHLPGTDPEEPAKLTDREILNMNKKKKNFKMVNMHAKFYFSNFFRLGIKNKKWF